MTLFSKGLGSAATLVVSALLIAALGPKATADQPPVATIQRLTAGDRACYVELVDDGGQTSTEFAAFEICEQDLVGKRVSLTYEAGNILAEACQGDPDCGQSETVMLITKVETLAETAPTVQTLADGNYRYWSGPPSQTLVSNDALLANGGTVFLFRKQGNNVTGIFSYVDGEAICVRGQVNSNTVSGIAVQTGQGVAVLSSGETFARFGPSGALSLRRGRQISRQQVRYGSALLNLNGLNRINVGTRLPPGTC
jgi:hypothetical protein